MELALRVRLGILVTLTLSIAVVWTMPGADAAETPPFTVTFLTIGQGDAIFIETPDHVQVLVDGGPGSTVLTELAAVMGAFDHSIDMVVASHPDADHIGGLVPVLERYNVSSVLLTENENDTNVSRAFRDEVATEGARVIDARAGQTYTLGASTTMTVLSPVTDPTGWESNESSIVLKVTYGDTGIILTGDAPVSIEKELVQRYGDTLHADVVKLGHHGSRTSSSKVFLDAVDPAYAIISAGKDNRYGHPHEEVVTRVHDAGIETVSTVDGRVTVASDGQHLTVTQ
jgi:competence protein ComEC